MYSINNKYSVIEILLECKYREKCDWAFNLFATWLLFPKCLKHAFLFMLDTNSATSRSTITKNITH